MALPSSCRNLFGAQQHVDINVVTIVITANGRDADRSSPETTVGAGSSGGYVCTMPSGQYQVSIGQECVNAGTAASGDKVSITSLSSASGVTTFTATKSDTTNLAGAEEMHITFLVFGS